MDSSEITLEAVSSVSQIAAEDWDACANPVSEPDSFGDLDTLASSNAAGESPIGSASRYNPFVSHAFFSALEASGSACARTGWGPRHLVARLDGGVAGIVPSYLKSHSQGEYVFDRGWADAYERAGGRYYPKLQASVPFTPAAGPRLLIPNGVDPDRIGSVLAGFYLLRVYDVSVATYVAVAINVAVALGGLAIASVTTYKPVDSMDMDPGVRRDPDDRETAEETTFVLGDHE